MAYSYINISKPCCKWRSDASIHSFCNVYVWQLNVYFACASVYPGKRVGDESIPPFFGRYTFRSSTYTSRARAYTPESGGGTRVYLRLTKVYHFRKKRILFCMKGILLKQNVYSSLFLPNGAGLGLRGFGVQGGRSGVGAGTLVGPGP